MQILVSLSTTKKEMATEKEDMKNNLGLKDAKLASLENMSKDLKIENEHLKNETRQLSKSFKTKEYEVARLQN